MVDNMMADGVINLDDRPAVAAVDRANAALDGHERQAKTVLDRTGKAWEVMGGTVVRVSDRSKSSLDRLLESMQRQADMAGKTGVERLVMQRDQLIARWQKEQGAVDAITASYQKLIAAEMATGAGAGAGLKDLAAEARESKASLALMGEEIGVHIPRHIRGFIAELPGVGSALSMAFNAVAVFAVVTVIYEAIKKVVEFHEQLERLREAPEKVAAEFARLNDVTKTANDEMKLANDRLENAIAKLEHRPQNNLKLAIDEAAVAADHLAEKMDKALRSFAELVVKNSPGKFAQIFERQPGTEDIANLITGKSGFGGMVGEMYKVTSAGGDPGEVLAKYRPQVEQMLRQSEYSKAYQEGKAFEGHPWGYNYPNRPNGMPPGIESVAATAEQTTRIETLQALMRQMDLLQQSYGLEKKNSALATEQSLLKSDSSGGKDLDAAMRAQQRELAGLGDDKFASLAAERQEAINDALDKYKDKAGPLVDLIKQVYDAKWVKEFNTESEQTSKEITTQAERWEKLTMEAAKFRDTANEKAMAEVTKALDERSKAVATLAKEYNNLKSTGATQELTHDKRMIQIGAGSSDPLGALAQEQTLDYVNIARRRQEALSNISSDPVQAVMERANAEKTAANEVGQLRYAWEEKVAELQHQEEETLNQEIETLKRDSESLWNTLLTKPQEFGKRLGATIHAAVLKPITEGLSNVTANLLKPIIYGADGQGGIAGMFKGAFGGKQDPMKVATDMNTAVTAQNSMAVATLTAVLSGVMGMAPPAMAAPAGIGGLSLPAISAPAVSGGVAASGGYGPLIGGGAGGIGGGLLTSAGIPTFMGGSAAGRAAGGGFNPLAMVLGGGRSGGGASAPNFAGILKNFKGMNWGGFTHGPDVYSTDANGSDIESQGKITGVNGVAGAALFTGGTMLAQQGLLGSSRGTWGGVGMGAAGGAMIGMQMGGPLGAAIGAGAGALAGIGEKIAGVETPEAEAKRLIKQIYSLTINDNTAKQIASIAREKFGNTISVAVRSPEVRQLLQLYAESTGQKSGLFLQNPQQANLVQAGGQLNQSAVYNNGTPYTYASNLPVMGPAGTQIPTGNPYAGSGPITVQVSAEQTQNLWATGTAQAIAGGSRAVADSAVLGQVAGAARISGANAMFSPDTVAF